MRRSGTVIQKFGANPSGIIPVTACGGQGEAGRCHDCRLVRFVNLSVDLGVVKTGRLTIAGPDINVAVIKADHIHIPHQQCFAIGCEKVIASGEGPVEFALHHHPVRQYDTGLKTGEPLPLRGAGGRDTSNQHQ